ncbi:MAG: GlsB/YeaQ/YmgE family stress response membrane protein [Roseiflexus sp.]
MDLLQLLILLVIVGICGAVAGLIVGFSPPGLHVMLVSIIIGVIGAFIGAWLAGMLNLPPVTEIRVGTIRLNLLYTIVGSTLLMVLLQALHSSRRWLMTNKGK